jgi:hypothetical protein
MEYTLIYPNGKVMTFYVLDVAKMYQNLYGGTLVDSKILEEALYINSNV